MSINVWQDAQNHEQSEKCKLKYQQDFTFYSSRWKNLRLIASVADGNRKNEYSQKMLVEMWFSSAISLKKHLATYIELKILLHAVISPLGISPREIQALVHKNMWMRTLNTTLFRTKKKRKKRIPAIKMGQLLI